MPRALCRRLPARSPQAPKRPSPERRGAGRVPARRGVAPQLHVRRRDRCVPRGAEDRSEVRDGVLGRGDELQPAAVVLRGSRARAGRRSRSSAPTPAARIAKAKTPREQGYLRAVEALFGPGDKRARDRPRTRRRWRRSPPRIRPTMRRRRSMRWRCWRRCRAATRRCRSGSRPARSRRRCSRAIRSIPAPRTTSCTPTTTDAGGEGAAGGARLREDRAGGEPRAPHARARVPAAGILG